MSLGGPSSKAEDLPPLRRCTHGGHFRHVQHRAGGARQPLVKRVVAAHDTLPPRVCLLARRRGAAAAGALLLVSGPTLALHMCSAGGRAWAGSGNVQHRRSLPACCLLPTYSVASPLSPACFAPVQEAGPRGGCGHSGDNEPAARPAQPGGAAAERNRQGGQRAAAADAERGAGAFCGGGMRCSVCGASTPCGRARRWGGIARGALPRIGDHLPTLKTRR